jgi:hypothetical protein
MESLISLITILIYWWRRELERTRSTGPLKSRVHASLNNYLPWIIPMWKHCHILCSIFFLSQLEMLARMRFLFWIALCLYLYNAYVVLYLMGIIVLICYNIKELAINLLIDSIMSFAASLIFILYIIGKLERFRAMNLKRS